MKKVFVGVLVGIYIVIAIITTVLLLNFDGQNGAKIGNNYFINIREKLGNYNINDLVIISDKQDYIVNDEIMYFKVVEGEKKVAIGKVKKIKQVDKNHKFVYVSDKVFVESKEVLGKTDDATLMTSFGGLCSFLESKVGFLIIIVLPIFLIFAYQLFAIKREIKDLKKRKK